MPNDFDDPPRQAVGVRHVEAWMHELNEIKLVQLNIALNALIKELSAAPSPGVSKAKNRIEHEIKGLTDLSNRIKEGLARL